MKTKKKRMEKKLIREFSSDAKIIEEERKGYESKLDKQKALNYKKLRTELDQQQM